MANIQDPMELLQYQEEIAMDLNKIHAAPPQPRGRKDCMSLYHWNLALPLRMKSSRKFVLLILAEAADQETGECWPGIVTLEERTCLSERQLLRIIPVLRFPG